MVTYRETSRPAAFNASIVGLSSAMKDSKVEAPIRSPAAAKTVSGVGRAQLVDSTGQNRSTRLDPVRLDAAVEVVDSQHLNGRGFRAVRRGG